jgi:hypothetical protein
MAAEGGEPQIASADAVWVVATLEVVQRVEEPDLVCATELLGPDQRVWEPGTSDVSRSTPQFCRADELRLGEPFRFEQIFEVPVSYAGGLAGVVIRNHAEARPQQVLVPT